MRSRVVVGLVLVLILIGGVTIAAAGQLDDKPRFNAEHSDFDLDSVKSFTDFPLYYLGESFEGLPITAITRRLDKPNPAWVVRGNYVAFLYGDCTASDDTGCGLPLEVQIWPACERNLSSYSLTPDGRPLPHQETTQRGVPAAIFEDGMRLELYTGEVTIVIFGFDQELIRRAGDGLRAVNGQVGEADLLPPPLPGALEGRLACGA